MAATVPQESQSPGQTPGVPSARQFSFSKAAGPAEHIFENPRMQALGDKKMPRNILVAKTSAPEVDGFHVLWLIGLPYMELSRFALKKLPPFLESSVGNLA